MLQSLQASSHSSSMFIIGMTGVTSFQVIHALVLGQYQILEISSEKQLNTWKNKPRTGRYQKMQTKAVNESARAWNNWKFEIFRKKMKKSEKIWKFQIFIKNLKKSEKIWKFQKKKAEKIRTNLKISDFQEKNLKNKKNSENFTFSEKNLKTSIKIWKS